MTSAFLASDCVGRTIDGRFTLLRWLGGTEQSSVFLIELEGDPPKKAAIKLTPANADDAETRIAQCAVAAALSHPHLLQVFYAGRCRIDGVDLLYVVTEYAEEILSEILRERPLTPGETREMLDPILDALSWLHSQNLVHGHLKPSNIMVVENQLKLSTDHLHPADEPATPSRSNSKYDAPEIALGKISPASDVWSLGVVLGEVLTQRPRLADGSSGNEPVVPASIPPPFFGIVRECLRLDPARRSTLTDIRDSLKPARTGEPAAKIPATPPPQAAPSKSPLSSGPLMIVGAVLVVGVIIAVLVLGSHHQPSPPPVQSSAPATQPPPPGPEAQAQSPVPKSQPPVSSPVPTPTPGQAATQPPTAGAQAQAPSPGKEAQAQPPSPSPPTQPASPDASAQAPSPAAETAPPHPSPPTQSHAGSVVKGAVASQSTPDVPQHIRDTIQGHVRVAIVVQVDAGGAVTDATIDSPGPSKYFANRAVESARSWKFTPAQADGHSVASTWTLQFHFGKDGTTVTPTETSP